MFRSLLALLLCSAVAFGQGTRADYDRAHSLDGLTAGKTFRDKISPHWLPGGDSFWYRVDLAGGKKEYVLVDAAKGERQVVPAPPKVPHQPGDLKPRPSTGDSSEPASIHFVNHSGQTAMLWWIDAGGKRHDYGAIQPNESRQMSTYVGHVWWIEGQNGVPLGVFEGGETDGDAVIDPPEQRPATPPAAEAERPARAPREWRAFIREHNVWIRSTTHGEEVQLTKDGTADDEYREPFHWSPDGTKFVANQVKPGQERKVYLVQSSPSDQLQPKLDSYEYLKPGDRIDHPRPRLFDVTKRSATSIQDDLFPNPWSLDDFHWAPDNSHFFFIYNQRGHQVLRMISVDAATGEAHPIIEEKSAAFIDYSQKSYHHWLDATGEIIWMSERDGWNHLYLIDTRTGAVKAQITHGKWNVRSVESVDDKKRLVWFRAMGGKPEQDPYYFHLARAGLDGNSQVSLTQGDGTHTWEWSPDHRYFIDTWSRVDQPPTIELRREADGKLMSELEHADVNELLATGWHPPEHFVAKGRDGQTDIYGIIIRPLHFDPAKKYPVIEDIYAGPQDFFVPKAWGRQTGSLALAELGFIVVRIDGMGTNWRSRAFHEVCFKNLKDAGFPDRIAWMRAAASTRPWMDLSRVGVFGGSAGGQNALGALLFHGDFYKAAVADCGCHDNRMDKIWWNEAWMGWPIGPEYADCSNVTHAANLTGNLMLVVGEMDKNVDPSSTMQVVNALIKADKDFDLLVVPGAGHGASGSPYGRRRRDDFFVRHLLGVEPRSS